MNIIDLFERDIRRSINGVVKADQNDAPIVWQELDEFVITKELRRHMSTMVGVLVDTLDMGVDAADKNGVWVSGFFGSGKSHFIKVLSHVLENREHTHEGESRRAVSFFEAKLEDAMLFADLKRAVAATTDTILFNIDSKADHRSGRDALLQVFLKVLNEAQGYSPDHPHIAHMERYLDEQGKLDTFAASFKAATGSSWHEERDAWDFHRDEVVSALSSTLGQSTASAEKWVDNAEDNFSLTVENFAKWVRRYLDRKGPNHRVMFLVDEVGQFIGTDTHMMLNLQTVTEQLGTVCGGRAWVVVTSQEDLDAVLGDLKQIKRHDHSKIQGRFKTRLSLSSANVDEVIKKRLLDKTAAARTALEATYEGQHDILKNQLSFESSGMTFKAYQGVEDFVDCYPFPAYQFELLQKVFESIRKAGATGLHLAQGERSLLDAFQSAARQLETEAVGALAPFYRFYPAIESFLDGAVKRTIDHAGSNLSLKPFDATLLRVLFLIRYVDELPGTVGNLATLCVDRVDVDKLALRRTIEASLQRLENETLIARNGDLYFFLTNEERDIGREIKSTVIAASAESRELGKLMFEEVWDGVRKHTYSKTSKDFAFTRVADDYVVGQRLEGSLEVMVSTPLGDRYEEHQEDARCIMESSQDGGRIVMRLPDDASLGRELRTYIQTDTYVRMKQQAGGQAHTTERILRDRKEENRERRKRLYHLVRDLLSRADVFVSGQRQSASTKDPSARLSDAFEYLIGNAYPKMGYIAHQLATPKVQLQALLRSDDVAQAGLDLAAPSANPKALAEVREYLKLAGETSRKVVLHDLVHKRFGGRPYGWPEGEVLLLVARLWVGRQVTLVDTNTRAPLQMKVAYEAMISPGKQKRIVLTLRKTADAATVRKAIRLGKDLFMENGPDKADDLYVFLKDHVATWRDRLAGYLPVAQTGRYPGAQHLADAVDLLGPFASVDDTVKFLTRFVEYGNDLLDLQEDLEEVEDFYRSQRTAWDHLRAAVDALAPNRMQLEQDPKAGPALAAMKELLAHPKPYGRISRAAAWIATAREVNETVLQQARMRAVAALGGWLEGIEQELQKVEAAASLRETATARLKALLDDVGRQDSIAHIAQCQAQGDHAFNAAMDAIEAAMVVVPPPVVEPPKPPGQGTGTPPVTPPTPPVAPPPPKLKPRTVVEAKRLCTQAFLETPEEVEAFVATLRQTLLAALERGERVQLK